MATRSGGVIRATAHDAADGLAEEQVRALGRGVRGEDQARDVDAFADHVDGDEPARSIGVAAGEALDPGVGLRFIAEHHDRLLTGDRAQQRARRAGVGAVVAQDEPGGVGDDSAGFGQERVGVAQHLRQQRGARVDRRSEAARVVGRVQLVGEGRDRLLGVHAPAQRRVEQPERERTADVIADGLAVPVDEVGGAATLFVVADERNRPGIRAKRRAGQGEAVARAVERGAERGTPGRGFARMMDLVQHHERRAREVVGEQIWRLGDLLVGHDDAVDVR